jgi:O-antigen/teichoic acid export membrane protein
MSTPVDEIQLPENVDGMGLWQRFKVTFGQQGVALADQALVSGTNFLTALLVGRVAGTEELGIYSLGFTLIVFALCFQDALIASPYTIYVNRVNRDDRPALAGIALAQLLILALIVCIALGAAAVIAPRFWPQGSIVLATLALTIPWVLAREFYRRFQYANLFSRGALVLDISVAALQCFGLVALAAAGLLSAISAHATIGFICGLCAAIALFLSRRCFAFRLQRSMVPLTRHWSFGRWMLASQLTALGYWYLVNWVVAGRLGVAETGEFVACMAVVTVANPFILGFGNIVGPSVARAFAEGGVERVRKVLHRATLPLFVFAIVLAGLAALGGGELVSFLYAGDFTSHRGTIAILGLLVPLVATGTMADHGLRAIEQPRVNFKASLVSLGVTVAITWFLLAPYGLTGAALGLLAGEVAGSFIRWSTFWRLTQRDCICQSERDVEVSL